MVLSCIQCHARVGWPPRPVFREGGVRSARGHAAAVHVLPRAQHRLAAQHHRTRRTICIYVPHPSLQPCAATCLGGRQAGCADPLGSPPTAQLPGLGTPCAHQPPHICKQQTHAVNPVPVLCASWHSSPRAGLGGRPPSWPLTRSSAGQCPWGGRHVTHMHSNCICRPTCVPPPPGWLPCPPVLPPPACGAAAGCAAGSGTTC